MAPMLRPKPNVVTTKLDDEESVLLDLKTRRYYSMNEVAARIWELLEEGKNLSAITDTIVAEWDVSAEKARQHVQNMINEFKAENLIEEIPDA